MIGFLYEVESEIACVNNEEHRALIGVGCRECGARTWESVGDGSQDTMRS